MKIAYIISDIFFVGKIEPVLTSLGYENYKLKPDLSNLSDGTGIVIVHVDNDTKPDIVSQLAERGIKTIGYMSHGEMKESKELFKLFTKVVSKGQISGNLGDIIKQTLAK
jgi:hypothetical protein